MVVSSKRYNKEINAKYAIIGSFIPIWNFFIAIRLGRKYGTLWLITDMLLVNSFAITLVFIENTELFFIGLILLFPIHILVTYLFIKKYNMRVKNG